MKDKILLLLSLLACALVLILDINLIFLLIIVSFYFSIAGLGSYFICMGFFINTKCKIKTDKKVVMLSFDDGPCEQTIKVLDLLKEFDAKANFFCIGENIEKYPQIAKRIVDEGHILANHSYYHSHKLIFSSPKKIVKELEKTNQLISQITNEKVKYYRPYVGITSPLIAAAVRKMKMQVIGWSIRSFDTVSTTDDVLKKLKNKTKSGSIVLLHDRLENSDAILREYLEFLKENQFETLCLGDD